MYHGSDLTVADIPRLKGQTLRVFNVMKDHAWHTCKDVADETGDPPESVSRQFRYLRAPKFGGHTVEKRHVNGGLWEYRLSE